MNAIIFPGQGAQYKGMGKDLYDNFSEVRDLFVKIDSVLGFSISKICFEGDLKELNSTYYQQLAILSTSLAAYELFKKKDIIVNFISGLSLGECSSLYPSGVLNLEDLVYLVKERARAMEESSIRNPSQMLAVIGLDKDTLSNIKEINFYIANINSRSQIVISVRKEDKEKVKNLLESKGAKVIVLDVSGGFHSFFMEPAKQHFKEVVNNLEFKRAKIPIVSNFTGKLHFEPQEIKNNLIEQLTSPVLWKDCVEFMIQEGVKVFFEIGPSRILRGMIKKINSNVSVINIEKKEDLDKLSAESF